MRYLVLDKTQRINITGKFPKRVSRILEELDKSHIDSTFSYYDGLRAAFANGILSMDVDGEPLNNFTHILLGGHHASDNSYELKRLIIEFVEQWNSTHPGKPIKVQNATAMSKLPHYTKIWMAKICLENSIPHLKSYFSADRNYHLDSGPIEYPLIAKVNSGENSIRIIDGVEKVKKKVFLIKSLDDWNKELLDEMASDDYMIQEFTDVGEDLRLFVSNGNVIGGWKRVSPPDSFITVTKGSNYYYHNTPKPAERELAERLARALAADFLAVDIIYKGKEPYVLEFSLHPGFNAYETKCQEGEPVNIAEAIVNSFPE